MTFENILFRFILYIPKYTVLCVYSLYDRRVRLDGINFYRKITQWFAVV